MKKTLGKLKEEASSAFNNSDYIKALEICNQICDSFPKNEYGYLGKIKALTNNYNIYIADDEQVSLKQLITKVKDKKEIDLFNEYINDCKEVANLNKTKKELTSKYFLKYYYDIKIAGLKNCVNVINSHKINGKKIKNVYDLINGLFFFTCLIYNLIYINYLLFLTIPFGIYGIINVYTFIDDNFVKNKRYNKKEYNNFVNEIDEKVNEYKKNITKNEELISFFNDQKITNISKVPKSFLSNLKNIINNNEEETAKKIISKINNETEFKKMLIDYTLINYEDLKENYDIEDNIKIDSSLNLNKNKVIYMKKVKPINIIMIVVFIVISVFSIIILCNNFYELNLKSFIIGLSSGIVSCAIYNIATGKNKSLNETFNDNLLSSIFKASLAYDLVYISITKELDVAYGFIEIPLVFLLVLIGYIMIISYLKYNNLLRRLRK